MDYWKKTSVIGVFIAMRWKVGSPYEGEDRQMLVGQKGDVEPDIIALGALFRRDIQVSEDQANNQQTNTGK